MAMLGHCEMENRNYIVYRISNVFDEDTYIGCTFNTIAHRFNQHVAKSKQTDTRLARKIRDIGRENLSITDLYSRWMTLQDARKIEGGLIKLLEATLNMKSAGGFYDEDWNWDVLEYQRDRNSVKIQCECGGRYTMSNKAKHFKTQRHLSSVSVFSSPPCSPPPHTVPLPDDDSECHSE